MLYSCVPCPHSKPTDREHLCFSAQESLRLQINYTRNAQYMSNIIRWTEAIIKSEAVYSSIHALASYSESGKTELPQDSKGA